MKKPPDPGLNGGINEIGLTIIEQTINDYVSVRLAQSRKMLGMTQQDLGEFLGVSAQQVNKYENGKNRLGAAKMFRIAQLLGTSTEDYFFAGLNSGERQVDGGNDHLVKRVLEAPPHIRKAIDLLLRELEREGQP